MESQSNEIPYETKTLLRDWKNLYRFWWALHYVLGVTGIVAAAIGAITNGSNSLIESDETRIIIGLVATLAASIVTLLGPIQKAERYFSSFHVLDQAYFELRTGIKNPQEFALRQNYARSLLCSNHSGQNDAEVAA